MTQITPTNRTKPGRKGDRFSADLTDLYAVVDECLVAHLGFIQDGTPFVLPTCAWRVDNDLYFHFALKGRFADALRGGAEICATLSIVDGLVLARSAMHHSVNYRSVMLLGRTSEITDPGEKDRILAVLVDKVWPGRSQVVRAPDAKELAVTSLFRMPISEGSCKVRSGPPVDRSDDLELPVWGGMVPVRLVQGEPVPDQYVQPGVTLI